MAGRILSPAEVLAAIPQGEPFRFVDDILEIDDEHVVGRYRLREDASFYRGHFPGNPVTPGVILIEIMAQAGVVAHGIYLLARQQALGELEKLSMVFTDASAEFHRIVRPGEELLIRGRKRFFRRNKLASEVSLHSAQGEMVSRGVLAGMGVAP